MDATPPSRGAAVATNRSLSVSSTLSASSGTLYSNSADLSTVLSNTFRKEKSASGCFVVRHGVA